MKNYDELVKSVNDYNDQFFDFVTFYQAIYSRKVTHGLRKELIDGRFSETDFKAVVRLIRNDSSIHSEIKALLVQDGYGRWDVPAAPLDHYTRLTIDNHVVAISGLDIEYSHWDNERHVNEIFVRFPIEWYYDRNLMDEEFAKAVKIIKAFKRQKNKIKKEQDKAKAAVKTKKEYELYLSLKKKYEDENETKE